MPFKALEKYLDEVPGSKIKIKYKDVFDIKEFYTILHDWLIDYGWGDLKEGSDHWENYYFEKIGAGGAKDISIFWQMKKKADGAPLTYYLDLNMQCQGLAQVELVTKDGKKIKTFKGEIEISISSYIERNYEKELEKHRVLKPFLNLFNQRVYKTVLGQREKELYQEVYVLQNFIKQWFKMKRYLPYEEVKGFYPSHALPSHMKE